MTKLEQKYQISVRVTAIVLQENKILLVKQRVGRRDWSLPGGRLEQSEKIGDALKREILEETGLSVEIERFLYLTETPGDHLIHLSFLCRCLSGSIRLPTNEFDQNPIKDVRFVKTSELSAYGFSPRFKDLVEQGFPDKGNYLGEKTAIGL